MSIMSQKIWGPFRCALQEQDCGFKALVIINL